MKKIIVSGWTLHLTDDASILAVARTLESVGRKAEADLLRLSVGQNGEGSPCERQPVRVIDDVVVPWASPSFVTPVAQENGKAVDVVTEYESVSSVRWPSLTDAQREVAEKLIADIHAANIEVAQSPACVQQQFWQTLPEEIDPSDYASVAREWLAAARQDVAKLGLI